MAPRHGLLRSDLLPSPTPSPVQQPWCPGSWLFMWLVPGGRGPVPVPPAPSLWASLAKFIPRGEVLLTSLWSQRAPGRALEATIPRSHSSWNACLVSLNFSGLDSKRGLMLSLYGKDTGKFQMKITKPFRLSAGIFTLLHKG